MEGTHEESGAGGGTVCPRLAIEISMSHIRLQAAGQQGLGGAVMESQAARTSSTEGQTLPH